MLRSYVSLVVLTFVVLTFLFDSRGDFSLVRQLTKDESASSGDSDKVCVTPELHGEWVRETPPSNEMNMSFFVGKNSLLEYEQCGTDFVDNYQWKAADVAAKFDPHEFCRLLGNRTIAAIGDSTLRQTYMVLGSMASLGGCEDQIKHRNADTLIKEDMGVGNRGYHWHTLGDLKPDIVILSAGAHIITDGNYTRMLDKVVEGIESLRKWIPNIQVVWKTQSPAGGYPTSFASPEGFPPIMYASNTILPGHPEDAARIRAKDPMYRIYNHQEFWRRDNSILIPKLQQHGIPFLDVRMLYNRVDAHGWLHGDALHFCMPGALRIIPLLMHRLLENDFEVSQCISMR